MEDGPHGAARLSRGPESAPDFCPNTSFVAVESLELEPAPRAFESPCCQELLGLTAKPALRSAVMRIVFGEHVLDPNRRELTRGSKAIAVGPQVFDLLVHLVRNRERVVTKDDLIEVVWGGRIVSESTLTSHINAVRKAIGDTGEQQRLVRTIARKG